MNPLTGYMAEVSDGRKAGKETECIATSPASDHIPQNTHTLIQKRLWQNIRRLLLLSYRMQISRYCAIFSIITACQLC